MIVAKSIQIINCPYWDSLVYFGQKMKVEFSPDEYFASLPIDVVAGFAPFEDKPKTFLMNDGWSLLFFKYPGSASLGEERFSIRPGLVGLIPPGVRRYFSYLGKSHHVFVHFGYTQGAARLPENYPLVRDSRDQAQSIEDSFLSIIRCQVRNPLMAKVTLWQLLLLFDDLSVTDDQVDDQVRHPALDRAMDWIELNLSHNIAIADVVVASGSPERSLRRMFRANGNTTITGYIRQRRMEHAYHLLQSTTLAVKEVAYAVGIPDLHLFNKTVKRYWGKPPRLLRRP